MSKVEVPPDGAAAESRARAAPQSWRRGEWLGSLYAEEAVVAWINPLPAWKVQVLAAQEDFVAEEVEEALRQQEL
jgi:hypothetical protein